MDSTSSARKSESATGGRRSAATVLVTVCILAFISCIPSSYSPFVYAVLLARLCLVCTLGLSVSRCLPHASTQVERLALGIASITVLLLVGTVMFAPNSFALRVLVSVVTVAFAVLAYFRKPSVQTRSPLSLKQSTIVVSAVLAPLVLIVLLNPHIIFLSDGWWHASVYNQLTLTSQPAPFPNPWLAGAALAYPTGIHCVLTYLFGNTQLSAQTVFFLATLVYTAVAALLIAHAVARRYTAKVGIAIGTGVFLCSTIGALAFAVDALRFLFGPGLGAFLNFLQVHQGPHMWYTAMKFIHPAGVYIPLQASAMMGFYSFPFIVGMLVALWEKKHWLAAILFIPILASNPIHAMIATVFICFVLLLDFGISRGILYCAGLGLVTATVNARYLATLLSKTALSSGGSVSLFSNYGLWAIVLFLVGMLPFVIIGAVALYKHSNRREQWFFVGFFAACLAIVLSVRLAYIFTSTIAVFGLALLCAAYFAQWPRVKRATRVVIGLSACVGLCSTMLLVATYGYYTIHLDVDEQSAAKWLRENTPADSVVLADVGSLSNRSLKVAESAFGKRRVVIADIPTQEAYGESYDEQATVYNSVFVDKNPYATCTLKSHGIDYVTVRLPEDKAITSLPCLQTVYEKGIRAVLQTMPADTAGS